MIIPCLTPLQPPSPFSSLSHMLERKDRKANKCKTSISPLIGLLIFFFLFLTCCFTQILISVDEHPALWTGWSQDQETCGYTHFSTLQTISIYSFLALGCAVLANSQNALKNKVLSQTEKPMCLLSARNDFLPCKYLLLYCPIHFNLLLF